MLGVLVLGVVGQIEAPLAATVDTVLHSMRDFKLSADAELLKIVHVSSDTSVRSCPCKQTGAANVNPNGHMLDGRCSVIPLS